MPTSLQERAFYFLTRFLYPGKNILLQGFISLFSFSTCAQVTPAEGELLYQNQVMLSIPQVLNASHYIFTLNEDERNGRTVSYKIAENAPATLVSDLKFDRQYRWTVRIETTDTAFVTPEYTFSTARQTYSDTSIHRFSIIEEHTSEKSYQDGIIMLDYANIAINRKGEVVWFMNPWAEPIKDVRHFIRPLRLTPEGNLVFTSTKGAFEFSLSGKKLWQAPLKIPQLPENPLFYHHEIQKLADGSYITLVRYRMKTLIPQLGPDSLELDHDAIVFFDHNNQVKWFWKLGDHLSADDKAYHFKENRKGKEKYMYLGEINSVYLDEKKSLIYVGVKDMNTILLVKYPSGEILMSYGDPVSTSPSVQVPGSFKFQHGGVPDRNGNLWVFNNNGEFDSTSSEIAVFSPPGKNSDVKEIWRRVCDIDSLTPAKTPRLGYALPLDNGNTLVCMGFAGRLFELGPDKKIVWDCVPHYKAIAMNPDGTLRPSNRNRPAEWTLTPNFRAYFYPSLYPNFFVVQPHVNGKNIILGFYNKGFMADTYTLLLSKQGKSKVLTSLSVEKSNNVQLIIPRKKIKQGYALQVRSKNTGEIKTIKLQ